MSVLDFVTLFYLVFEFYLDFNFVLQQEPDEDYEILNSVRYSRPGNGFSPKFNLTKKVLVNGPAPHPIFDFLKVNLSIN